MVFLAMFCEISIKNKSLPYTIRGVKETIKWDTSRSEY